MKTYLYKVFNITALLIFISASFADGQITSSSSGGRNDSKTQQAEQAERIVNKLTNDSGILFKEGLTALSDNRRSIAGEKFDKSIEVFLMSGVDVQRNQKLRECYNQLIETVYRIEFPADNQLPQVRSLSATCSWDIKNETADNIAKLVRTQPNEPTNSELATAMNKNESQAAQMQVGFNEQKFEASPLDDLAKVELTPDEINIDTPEAQQQYQYAVYAVANKSLGFSFQMHPLVQQWVNYYKGRARATMETGLYRSGMFMRMARRIFREEGVPENVAWLAQVESSWKPSALSWASASGLWQFIPGTGARFGLRRTAYVDERNSFEEATRASAKYLKFLANRYGGNWELAMAAYNSGEGNVDRAIRRAGVANFWIAYPYLPQET
ncbi:MAG: lytic transglycosylase domain-containing protein, partial [Acidobacteriota bacterium]